MEQSMSEELDIVEINDGNRDQYGGDCELTSGPKIHPKMNVPIDYTRAAIAGGSRYIHSFRRGDIIYKHDPTKEFNFTWWANDGTQEARRMWMLLKIEKGFEVLEAKDWNLRPLLKHVIDEVDGQLVIPLGTSMAGKPHYEVCMVRSKERWAKEQRALHQVDIATKVEADIAAKISDQGVSTLPSQFQVFQQNAS
jgi:hypothetical protein